MADYSRDCPEIVTQVPSAQKERYKSLRNLFIERFGSEPAFFTRAPGRVNLIGEHIDYCGYSVLPMAIQQDILIAAGPNSDQMLVFKNTNPEYRDFTSNIGDFKIDPTNPLWHNYILCGFRGIVEAECVSVPSGMNLLVDGTIPPSAGLSSSSALVCCGSLVTMHINGLEIPKRKLADICMRCEHYIGTQGGGMDQSICFLAETGTAKWIQFNPIRATNVSLPPGVAFVISNSCVELQKAATSHFNIRVVECRLATQVLAKSKGLDWKQFKVLAKLQEALAVSLEEMLDNVENVLHPEPYSKKEICEILGVSEEELNKESLSQNTLEVTSFKLHDRAKHVFGEANRVMKFKEICDQAPSDAAIQLGELMSDSHTSCRDLYQCSCEHLDQLVELCRLSGSLGSRLTGAGWGGCAVSMVPSEIVDDFISKVQAGYYAANPKLQCRVKESLFATEPGNGANIFEMTAETSL
ncbi:N-acetylgalactosamine kinase-like isoform X1 [Acanthaster planci]|uniref:N-acetylgalactosamine kinase-like isoform X1 n=1 Tax=Acanthaster planci TaxID=133434 RepID=A0A8B7Z7B6_ACAPL|nr:N-acetylgalactosamine kinase-like isoform X1 [Acanthaster planci]